MCGSQVAWTAAASVSPAVLAIRRTVRRLVAGRPYHPRRFLIVSSWWMLREIEVQRHAPVCVLLLCRSVSGAAHQQDPFCGPSHNQIPGICLCHWATELARTNSKSRSRAPLLPTSSGNAATKLQVSSTVRQAAGLLGLALETLTGACRYSSHTFEGHGSHVPRIWWYRRIEDPAARPFRPRAVLGDVRLSPLAQSLSLEASLGRDLQAVQKQILADKARLAQLQAPHSLPEIHTHYKHSLGTQLSSAAGA